MGDVVADHPDDAGGATCLDGEWGARERAYSPASPTERAKES